VRLCAAVVPAKRGRGLTVPVRLDRLPPPAPKPARPRLWLWLALLPLCLLLGVGLAWVLGGQAQFRDELRFWSFALGAPLLGWSAVSFVRASLFIGQQRAAQGWDEAREADLFSRLRRARRSQQVLSVSVYTGLRDVESPASAQLDAFLDGTRALKAQPSRADGEILRHSHLVGVTDAHLDGALLQVLVRTLNELRQTLAQLPDDKPLALLLEVDSQLQQGQVHQLWQQAWSGSGIRQSTTPVENRGLAAVDQWLDQRITDQALLLVVAVQYAPADAEGTAEAAVGLLLGNRLTQATLPPMAYLHRPEQESHLTTETLRHAMHQALEWVPLATSSIEQVWKVGIDAQRDVELTTVLTQASMPSKPNQGFCNLDALLGFSGKASPWLAIAAAAQAIERGAGPQFIFSGDSAVDAGLWSTVLTPVPPLLK